MDSMTSRTSDAGGRTIFYEGEDPEGFRRDMIAEFGFDPAAPEFRGRYDETGEPEDHDTWGEWVPSDRFEAGGFRSYGFWCPPHAYQEVYATGRWPMGS